MKFKANRDHLSHALSRVVHTASSKSTTPILGSVLVTAEQTADGGTIAFATTNLDLFVECKVKGQVSQAGAVALPVKRLASIVNELPNADLKWTVSASHEVKIESGGSTFKIMGLGKDEFITHPKRPDGDMQTLEQSALAELLSHVAYAQSLDETRYILNGVHVEMSSNKVQLVATDGRRLSLAWHKGGVSAKGNMILPAKAVTELMRLLGAGKSVKLSMDNRRAQFDISAELDESGLIGQILLSSKVVEGNYPNYSQVVPAENDSYQRMKLFREEFLRCVGRAALVCNEKNNSVRIKLSKNLMEILAHNAGVGEAHERMDISYDGPEIQACFAPAYLIDPLRALTSDEIFFELKDETNPAVIKTLDGFISVIMPVRLS